MVKKSPESVRLRVMHCPRYDTESWHRKVMNMPVRQVMALDKSFKMNGYYDEPKTEPKQEWVQLTVWDYILEKENNHV